MAIQSLYPSSRPTLNLNFAKVKALDPRITFTRTTTAAYYNANGVLETAAAGEARFDHDPITGESLGLLVEEQRTNLVLQSQNFTTSWANTNTTDTADTETAPDGSTTADTLTDDATLNRHVIGQDIITALNTDFVFSCFLKAGTLNHAALSLLASTTNTRYATVVVDLSSGTITDTNNSTGTTASSTITSVGNGWYRVVLIARQTITAFTVARICLSDAGTPSYTNFGQPSYSGTGSTVYAWGAQLEAGAFPTSYIPTTTAQVTRAADSASMTGANFSSWYNQNEGTFYAECITQVAGTARTLLIAEASSGDRVELQINANNVINPRTVISGAALASLNGGTYTAGTNLKLSFAFSSSSYASSTNGLAAATQSVAGLLPIVNILRIGARGANVVNGHIRKISYYPERLTDAELQQLTK